MNTPRQSLETEEKATDFPGVAGERESLDRFQEVKTLTARVSAKSHCSEP